MANRKRYCTQFHQNTFWSCTFTALHVHKSSHGLFARLLSTVSYNLFIGAKKTNFACAAAASIGKLPLLQRLLKDGYEWDGMTTNSAAENGHLGLYCYFTNSKWQQTKTITTNLVATAIVI